MQFKNATKYGIGEKSICTCISVNVDKNFQDVIEKSTSTSLTQSLCQEQEAYVRINVYGHIIFH